MLKAERKAYHKNGMLTLHVFALSMAFFLIILRNRLQVLAPQTMFIL